MSQQKFCEGYVIVNTDGFIMDWSFKFTRHRCIADFIEGSGQTWKQWYKQGVRCFKATRTITVSRSTT